MTFSLDRIRSGDLGAFGDFYDASYHRVYAFIYHRTLDTPLTEDIVSMTYMKAIKNLKTLRAQTEGEIFSWILQIAYHSLIDTMKTKDDEILSDDLDAIGYEKNHATDIDNRSKLEEVLNFMNTLSERDRAMLSMRIWDDLSYEEISQITGESVANCKQIVSRGLAKIGANVSYLFIFSFLLTYVISH